jgi:hypothetical protein
MAKGRWLVLIPDDRVSRREDSAVKRVEGAAYCGSRLRPADSRNSA